MILSTCEFTAIVSVSTTEW